MTSLQYDDASQQSFALPQPTTEHPVINMPFTLVIDGRSYVGRGLSLVHAEATGLVTPQLLNEKRLVSMQFAFVGFNVNFNLDAQIIEASAEAGGIAVRFLNPAGPHLTQLRYLMNAYIAGELVGIDNILAIADDDEAVARPPQKPRSPLAGRIAAGTLRIALLAAATALLVTFVADRIYERFFVLPVSGVSVLSTAGTSLRAIASGQIAFVNPAAKAGDPAFAIRSTSGEVLTVQMPCACTAGSETAKVGDTVLSGDTVMVVSDAGAPLMVDVSVDADALRALVGGATAQVRFPNGASSLAVLPAGTRPAIPSNGLLTKVALLPKVPLDKTLAGTPVAVSILTNPWMAIATNSSFIAGILLNLGITS